MKKIYTVIIDTIFSCLIAVIFVFYYGYIFNTADQGEHLSLVYKNLDPQLYMHDFYVQACNETITVRYFYVIVVSFLAKFFSLYQLCLTLSILLLTSTILATIRIGRLLFGQTNIISTIPLFVFFVFYYWTIGGNAIQYNILISSSFAKAFAPWALYYFLKRRYISSAVLLGVATLFQVLVGLQLFFVFLFVICFEKVILKTAPLKAALVFVIFYLILGIWILKPIVFNQFFNNELSDTNMFYQILFFFRNPQHYIPELFPRIQYIQLTILLVIASVLIFIYGNKLYIERILTITSTIVLGLIIYTISLSQLDFFVIGKSQWFKTTIWLQCISAIAIGSCVDLLLSKSKNFAPIFCLALFAIFFGYKYTKSNSYFALDKRSDNLKDLSDMHFWIEKHTPKSSYFLSFPKDESFICEAKRSQFVAWNPIIHEPKFMLEWYRRYNWLTNNNLNLSDTYNSWANTEKLYPQIVSTKYMYFDYVLMSKDILLDASTLSKMKLLHHTKDYNLYLVKK